MKGPIINAIALVTAAVIGAGATIFVASTTGRLTTPSDTRESQKDKQENTRLKQENAGLLQENAGLQQQNKSLREELAQFNNTTTPAPVGPEESKANIEPVGHFAAQLQGCARRAGAVSCVLRVTNTIQERIARFYNSGVSIIDSDGNEQKSNVIMVGASTATGPFSFAETTFPTNIPVKVSVNFRGIEPKIDRLSRLALGMEWRSDDFNGKTESGQIEFRNIPLH